MAVPMPGIPISAILWVGTSKVAKVKSLRHEQRHMDVQTAPETSLRLQIIHRYNEALSQSHGVRGTLSAAGLRCLSGSGSAMQSARIISAQVKI